MPIGDGWHRRKLEQRRPGVNPDSTGATRASRHDSDASCSTFVPGKPKEFLESDLERRRAINASENRNGCGSRFASLRPATPRLRRQPAAN
jgi:hypothetical protein